MSSPRATEGDVAARTRAAFAPSDRVRIGAEVEWLVYDRTEPTREVTAPETAATAAGPLPADGAVTIEPGGQLELVTVPAAGPRALVEAIEADTAVLVERFARAGLQLVPLGLDPVRPPRRTLDVARYEAMERYFAERTPAGLRMMNLTASLQLNIDFGPDPAATWRRAHAFAPVLTAAFANSPTVDGSTFAPVSHRQQIWNATDPSRTRPVGEEPDDWHRYVLDAQVMLRGSTPSTVEPARGASTFEDWLRGDDPPTIEELDIHVTTLFPPLRPRGFLELRMIDAVPADGRAAAIATVWSLLTDADAADIATRACREVTWEVATEAGLRDEATRAAATEVLGIVATKLGHEEPELGRAAAAWCDRIETGEVAGTIDELLATAEGGGDETN